MILNLFASSKATKHFLICSHHHPNKHFFFFCHSSWHINYKPWTPNPSLKVRSQFNIYKNNIVNNLAIGMVHNCMSTQTTTHTYQFAEQQTVTPLTIFHLIYTNMITIHKTPKTFNTKMVYILDKLSILHVVMI